MEKFEASQCPETLFGRPVLLFNVARGIQDGERIKKFEGNIEKITADATLGDWRISEKWRERFRQDRPIAVGLVRGFARGAYSLNAEWKEIIMPDGSVRYRNSGDSENPLSQAELSCLMRNYSGDGGILKTCNGYWLRGNHLIFRIVKLERSTDEKPEGKLEILHGGGEANNARY